MTSSGIAYRRQPLAPRTSVTGSSPLLPTPTARAKGGSPVWNGRQGGLILDEAISRLLPTPRARTDKEHGPGGQHWGELRAEITSLLPTPTATPYGNNQSPSPNAAVRPSLDTAIKLLPGPRANDGLRLSPRFSSEGWRPYLEQELLSIGEGTDPPSGDGKPSTALRLSPSFVEWMIGAPIGWTDPDCPLSATEFKSNSARWSDGS